MTECFLDATASCGSECTCRIKVLEKCLSQEHHCSCDVFGANQCKNEENHLCSCIYSSSKCKGLEHICLCRLLESLRNMYLTKDIYPIFNTDIGTKANLSENIPMLRIAYPLKVDDKNENKMFMYNLITVKELIEEKGFSIDCDEFNECIYNGIHACICYNKSKHDYTSSCRIDEP